MTQPPLPPSSPTPDGTFSGSPEAKGFLGALFDFGFEHFITPKIVKVAYVLATVLIGLAILLNVFASLGTGDPALVLLTLVGGSLVGLFLLILVRMTLELYVALVRMSEDIHRRPPPQ